MASCIEETSCFQPEQQKTYDELNYDPLVKLMKKLLPHGIPELPKIHNQLAKHFQANGYIPLNKFLRIVNANRCLSDGIKKRMTGKPDDFHFEININHLLNAMEKVEALTWFDMTENSNTLMIRANFEHTLPIVDPLLISKDIITEDYIRSSGLRIYVRVKQNEVKSFLEEDIKVRHKTLKFWTSLYPSHYVNENNESDWVNIEFDSLAAIHQGFLLYMIEGRVICTKKNIPASAKIFFTIPKELFSCNMSQ